MSSGDSLVKRLKREKRPSFSPEMKLEKSRYGDAYSQNRKYLYNDYAIPEYQVHDVSRNAHNVSVEYSEKTIKEAINNYIAKKTI